MFCTWVLAKVYLFFDIGLREEPLEICIQPFVNWKTCGYLNLLLIN